jgi:hypothetical protein
MCVVGGLEAQFTKKQSDLYGVWRQSIVDGVEDAKFLRAGTYDDVIGVLFPEMARGIAKKYGQRALHSGA